MRVFTGFSGRAETLSADPNASAWKKKRVRLNDTARGSVTYRILGTTATRRPTRRTRAPLEMRLARDVFVFAQKCAVQTRRNVDAANARLLYAALCPRAVCERALISVRKYDVISY